MYVSAGWPGWVTYRPVTMYFSRLIGHDNYFSKKKNLFALGIVRYIKLEKLDCVCQQ
jgi:hypothetical protein